MSVRRVSGQVSDGGLRQELKSFVTKDSFSAQTSTEESKNISRKIIKVTTKDKSELISNLRKRKNNTSEILDVNLSPIKRIGLMKVHQSSTPARTMSESAIQTTLPTPGHRYTSMASKSFDLPERYNKQDSIQPYSLVKSWNAIQ